MAMSTNLLLFVTLFFGVDVVATGAFRRDRCACLQDWCNIQYLMSNLVYSPLRKDFWSSAISGEMTISLRACRSRVVLNDKLDIQADLSSNTVEL